VTESPAVTIYHNPACGTSRNTLALIRNAGAEHWTDEQLIDQMLAHPILINRPKGPFTKEDGEQAIDERGQRLR